MTGGSFNLGSLIVRLGADVTGLQRANTAMQQFSNTAYTGLSKVQQQLDSISNRMKRFGAGGANGLMGALGALAVPVGTGAIGGAAIKQFMEYETALAHIEGLTGATAEQTRNWSNQLKQMSGIVGKTPQELAEALYYIASSGVEASQAMDILNVSAKASMAGLGSTQQMADVLTSAMNAYAKSGLTAQRAVEILTVAVREGKIEASQFATHIGYVIPVAALMGVKFEQVTAAMAAMSITGADASTSATQLRQVLSDVLKPAVQSESALKQFGLSGAKLRQIIEDDGLLSAMNAINDIVKKFGIDTVAKVFPDVRSLTGAMQLMGENSEHVAEIFKEVAEDSVAFGKAVEVVSQTLQHRYNQALSQVNFSMIELGASMKSALIPIFQSIADMLSRLTRWYTSLSEAQQRWILIIGAVVVAAGPVIYILGSLIGTLSKLITVFRVLAVTIKTNPLFTIATVISGITIAMRGLSDDVDAAADSQQRLNDEFERTQSMRLAYEGIAQQMSVLGNLNKAQVRGLGVAIESQLTMLEDYHASALAKAKSDFDTWQERMGGKKGQETVNVVQRSLGGYGWVTGTKKESIGTDWSKIFEDSNNAAKQIEERISNLKLFSEQVSKQFSKMGGSKITDNSDMLADAKEIDKIFENHNQALVGLNRQAELFGPSMQLSEKYMQEFNGTLEKSLEYLPITDQRIYNLAMSLFEAGRAVETFKDGAKSIENLATFMEDYVESTALATIEVPKALDIEPIKQDYISDLEVMIWYNENFSNSLMDSGSAISNAKSLLEDYQKQFETLWARGVRPGEEAMDSLIEKMDRLNSAIKDSGPSWVESFTKYAGVVLDLVGTFEGFVNASQKRALRNVETTAKQQNKSDQWLAEQRERIELEYAKKAKALSIIQAIINTAVAVTKALPNIPLAVATGIAGAAQVALIASQPLAEGGIVPPGYPNDTYPARLTSGEVVVPPGKLDRMFGKGTTRIQVDDIVIDGIKLRIILKEVERTEKSAYY